MIAVDKCDCGNEIINEKFESGEKNEALAFERKITFFPFISLYFYLSPSPSFSFTHTQ